MLKIYLLNKIRHSRHNLNLSYLIDEYYKGCLVHLANPLGLYLKSIKDFYIERLRYDFTIGKILYCQWFQVNLG